MLKEVQSITNQLIPRPTPGEILSTIGTLSSRINKQEHDQGENQSTLFGLLNFIDGPWLSFGDERIIVFTTNHQDRIDPALLRSGHMGMHIHMPYSTPCGFKTLASNYPGTSNHSLFPEIEKLIMEVDVTPAEIAEELMKSEEANIAVEGLIVFLKRVARTRTPSTTNYDVDSATWADLRAVPLPSAMEVTVLGHGLLDRPSTPPSFAASALLIWTVLNEVHRMTNQLISQQLQEKILSRIGSLVENASSEMILESRIQFEWHVVSTEKQSCEGEKGVHRSIELHFPKRNMEKLTLYGLLNFIDLPWSSCGDERIIMFTTNRGVTAAEIAEELMKSEDANITLEGLIEFLKRVKTARNECNVGEGREVRKLGREIQEIAECENEA
ncbi:AAA-ATPase [Vitis vinifera]|uniref:AAA-ATPase n=1 Tax=Vitis vinifera TaxID=29760 RepID=A0A438DIN5_VITVI|nr:AAA-ATPase [Vitis vinifera]